MTQEIERPDIALGDIFDSMMRNIHTCMPGQVVSFDRDAVTCTVRPCFKRVYAGVESPVEIDPIENVPVILPGSDDLWLTVDLKADSYVLLVFAERSIANWFKKGGAVDPEQNRMFDFSDAFAIPCSIPTPAKLGASVESDTIAMRNSANTANVKVKTNGDAVINNGTGTAVEYSRLKTAFDQMKSDFNAHITKYNAHVHPDPASGVTGVPTVLDSASAADMSSSESATVLIP